MNWYFTCWKKYAVFEGRARRREYWIFHLVNLIIVLALQSAINITSEYEQFQLATIISVLYVLISLATLIPGLAVNVRRLHDTNRSGWWLLISLVPFIGAIVLFVFFVQDSHPGYNQYGPNPKLESALI